jgi:hypothetical protein
MIQKQVRQQYFGADARSIRLLDLQQFIFLFRIIMQESVNELSKYHLMISRGDQ